MLKYCLALIFAGAFTTLANAQQQPSPNEQALATKLMQEIQNGLSCNVNLLTAQADLAKANARIKEFEPKAEPSPQSAK